MQSTVFLKVEVNKQVRKFYYSLDNEIWMHIGTISDSTFLSDEGVLEGKHYTGAMVGMYANNGGKGTRIPADFDWFKYTF